MRHIALLGDSILDNRPYVEPQPDTAESLRQLLGAGWSVHLLARDGSMIADLAPQLEAIPTGTELAVLSIGGNDAMDHVGILDQPVARSSEVFLQLASIAEGFGEAYRKALLALRPRAGRLVACTVYEPPLLDEMTARLARIPLSLLNDRILREAADACIDVLDLRRVCTEPGDFVRDIEPSPHGARKIAAAIHAVALGAMPRSGLLGEARPG